MTKKENPSISVLVPVYNTGVNLRLCLDSLLEQSFQDFEIIIVDNGSTDESIDILKEYKNKYPDKVYVYTINHSEFVGTGRNYALKKARGKYIYICDSDDIVEKNALIWLQNRAEYYDADVVYGYFRFVNLQSNTVMYTGRDGEKEVTPGELILTGADYWRRLYKKELLDYVIQKVGMIPEDTNFDDVAWLPVVHSYAKKIRSADRIIYNYFRRTSSTVGGYSPDIIKYSAKSEQYILENVNPEYLKYAELYVARRIRNNLSIRWRYSDTLIEEIKYNWKRFSQNYLIQKERELYETLLAYNSLADTPMEKIVYVNGFSNEMTPDIIDYIEKNAFDQCKVIILNTENCNLKEVDKFGIARRDYKEIGAYFALQNICKSGGIYIGDEIKIDNVFNSLRYFDSFVGFISETDFSSSVFGGLKNSEVLQRLLETYQEEQYFGISFGDRVRNILSMEYNVKLNGETNLFDYKIAVLGVEVVCYNAYFGHDEPSYFHLCCHNFVKQINENANQYITIDNKSLYPLLKRNMTMRTDMKYNSNSKIIEENKFLKYRLNEIESSTSFKLALKIYKLGQKKFFNPLKKILKNMLD